MKNAEELKFGGVLKDIRTNRNLSVRGFASACGFSAVYISDLEKVIENQLYR